MCAAAGKWSLKIAREWSPSAMQWGRPIGEHEAIAKKIAFIAATTYALEAMVDLSSQLADDKRNDIRIEAALAKLYARRWRGRSPTSLSRSAAAAATRPRRRWPPAASAAVPAEQMLRDLRINRIFEGSTEIMHLFIAREAVDTHLAVAGELIEPGARGQRHRPRPGRRLLRPLAAHAGRR